MNFGLNTSHMEHKLGFKLPFGHQNLRQLVFSFSQKAIFELLTIPTFSQLVKDLGDLCVFFLVLIAVSGGDGLFVFEFFQNSLSLVFQLNAL